MMKWMAAVCAAALAMCEAQAGPVADTGTLSNLFAAYPHGCIAIYEEAAGRWTRHNPDRCKARFIPASTYKIPHAMMALQAGIVSGPDHTMEWDGTERSIPAWNRDHTLRTAVGESAVWYFERVAAALPTNRVTQWLTEMNYGNGQASGQAPYWINGDLAISCDEQIAFLRKMRAGDLPFDREVTATGRELIQLGAQGGGMLYGKTGWARPGGTNLGWFVGWFEEGSNAVYFATNLGSTNGAGFGEARKALTLRALGL